jgi:hypothetical protein
MTIQRLDLRRLHTPKIEALRGTFEGHLRATLFQGLPDGAVRQLLERAGTGYVEGHIDAAWNGFQWGGDTVRNLVQEALHQLDDDYKPAEVRKVGAEPADAARPNAEAVAASYYPSTNGEDIDWSLPLFDSDGYPHRLVELGGIQVVTRHSFAFVIWDRKSLSMVNNPDDTPLTIGNTPMSPEERDHRRQVGAALLGDLHAQAAAQRAEEDLDDERSSAPRG